jgi:Gram-negative bacterial TonB protein C-terminal
LQAGFEVEKKPVETTVAGRPAVFFPYWSPVAGLHWYTLSTKIRCHTVKIIMTSTGGGLFPVCIKDYARGDHLIQHEEPIFPMRRFNAVPVRIIIGKDGAIKHVHILTAFPEQEQAVYAALKKWRYRPYEQNGQPMEVETGIMFGQPLAPRPASGRVKTASK